jgi:hypothetical protein
MQLHGDLFFRLAANAPTAVSLSVSGAAAQIGNAIAFLAPIRLQLDGGSVQRGGFIAVLDAVEPLSDTVDVSVSVLNTGDATLVESGYDSASMDADVTVTGIFSATESQGDTFIAQGSLAFAHGVYGLISLTALSGIQNVTSQRSIRSLARAH